MKTEFTIFKSRENANFTGSAVLNLDDLKKAIKTAQKSVTKRDDVLNGGLVLNVSKNYGVITSSAGGVHTLVYFPVSKADADFAAVLSPDFISAIDAEKGKKIEAVIRCCICQIDLEYNGKKLKFENPRCDHYGIDISEGHASFTLASSDLKKAIERTAPCSGKNDGRYSLNGILLDAHENSGINFVSTDGCRMSVQTFEREINVNEQILISESNFRKIKNVFSGFNGDIEINADSSHVFFHAPLITVICEQLQGSFPGWESAFKQIRPDFSKITVKTADFRKIEAMKKDITKENPTVIFHKIERMDAIGAAAEEKPENAEIIGGSENDFPDIAFNFNFLLDFSKYVTDEEIQITYKDEKSGAVFACKDWKCLIMPKDKFYSFERYSKRMKDLREELEKRQEEEMHAREAMDAKKAELDRIHAEMKTAEGDAWKELDKKAVKISGKYWELRDIHYKKSSVLNWTKTDIKKCETLYHDLKKKFSEYFQKMESAVFVKNGIISAADAPENDETTQEAKDTTPANEAPKTQENATQENETKQAEKTDSPCAAVVLSSNDLRGDNFGKTLESVKNALTQGAKQEQKKEATWDGFLNQSKEVWINIAMNTGRFPMKVIYFPAEKIAIVKHKKTWYAIEAITGSAFYTMPNFHDLLNTLRHPENRTPILALIESVRSKNPALNPIDEAGNILDISPAEYEKMQAEGPKAAEKPDEKRVKIAPVESSAPLATVTPAEPAERPSVRASEPAPVESAPQPSEPSRANEPSRAEKPFEIGTYTTKKGKVKTAIRFFQPPTPSQIEALKTAFYWEYNGTWNGSPRKLPEIFKH